MCIRLCKMKFPYSLKRIELILEIFSEHGHLRSAHVSHLGRFVIREAPEHALCALPYWKHFCWANPFGMLSNKMFNSSQSPISFLMQGFYTLIYFRLPHCTCVFIAAVRGVCHFGMIELRRRRDLADFFSEIIDKPGLYFVRSIPIPLHNSMCAERENKANLSGHICLQQCPQPLKILQLLFLSPPQ